MRMIMLGPAPVDHLPETMFQLSGPVAIFLGAPAEDAVVFARLEFDQDEYAAAVISYSEVGPEQALHLQLELNQVRIGHKHREAQEAGHMSPLPDLGYGLGLTEKLLGRHPRFEGSQLGSGLSPAERN